MIINVIKSDFREYAAAFKQWFYLKRMGIRMGLAIRLADMKQRAFNKQYHVLIMELHNGAERLVSLNNRDIEALKRKRWLPKHATMWNLRPSIFYSTPLNRNNKSTAAERRSARDKYVKYARRFLK